MEYRLFFPYFYRLKMELQIQICFSIFVINLIKFN